MQVTCQCPLARKQFEEEDYSTLSQVSVCTFGQSIVQYSAYTMTLHIFSLQLQILLLITIWLDTSYIKWQLCFQLEQSLPKLKTKKRSPDLNILTQEHIHKA